MMIKVIITVTMMDATATAVLLCCGFGRLLMLTLGCLTESNYKMNATTTLDLSNHMKLFKFRCPIF